MRGYYPGKGEKPGSAGHENSQKISLFISIVYSDRPAELTLPDARPDFGRESMQGTREQRLKLMCTGILAIAAAADGQTRVDVPAAFGL
jgi:hypothetical protein